MEVAFKSTWLKNLSSLNGHDAPVSNHSSGETCWTELKVSERVWDDAVDWFRYRMWVRALQAYSLHKENSPPLPESPWSSQPRSTAPGGHKPWTHPNDCVCLPPLLDESIRLTPTKTCREVSSQSERRILQASLSPSSSPGPATKNSSMVEWTVTPSPCSVSLGYGADAFFPLQRFANASLRIRHKLCRMSSFLLFFLHISLSFTLSLLVFLLRLPPSSLLLPGGREIIQTQCILQALWSVLQPASNDTLV